MKPFIPALLAALITTGSAYAQSISVGPGGVEVDPRSPRERHVDREIRREERRERYERVRDTRDCRTITTTRETPRGEVRRTERVCD